MKMLMQQNKAQKARLRRLRSASSNQTHYHKSSASTSSSSSFPERTENNLLCRGGEGCSGIKGSGGLLYGHVSLMGRKRVMEEALLMGRINDGEEEYSYFGVYKGHELGGDEVGETCRKRLQECLERHIEKGKIIMEENNRVDWGNVMAKALQSTDEDDRIRTMMVLVVVSREEVVVWSCGDSRVVLCRDGVPEALSSDHKSDRPHGEIRVEAAGEIILDWNCCRIQGDHNHMKPVVTSHPEVTITKRTQSDNFLLIGTHGLWDVLGSEIACAAVQKCLDHKLLRQRSDGRCCPSEASTALAQMAISEGSRDNISIIVVQLIK